MARAASNCLILINYNNRHNLQWEAIAASGPNVWWGLKHGGPKFSLPGGPFRPLTEEHKRASEQKKIAFTARARLNFISKVSLCVYVYLPAFGRKEMLWGKEVQEGCISHMFGNSCVNWAARSPGSFYMCTHTPTHTSHNVYACNAYVLWILKYLLWKANWWLAVYLIFTVSSSKRKKR